MPNKRKTVSPRIAIYIEGGNVTDVMTNILGLVVKLVDCDNLRESGFSKDGVQQLWKRATKNTKLRAY